MRVAIYARVSTDQQTPDNQLEALRAVAARHGWTIVSEHVDAGISGAKGKDKRPAFAALWKQVQRREVDMIAAWAIDRIGRSLIDLVGFAAECDAKGVAMYFDRQAIDTSTPVGRMFFQIIGAIGQYERELIRERVKSGIDRYRKKNAEWGRPVSYGRKLDKVLDELRAGGTAEGVARNLQLSKTTVRRIRDRYLPKPTPVAPGTGLEDLPAPPEPNASLNTSSAAPSGIAMESAAQR